MDGSGRQVRPKLKAESRDILAPTIFHAPWWLNAVAGGAWRETTVHSGGALVGRFPFIMKPIGAGQVLCTMPPMTHFLGPAVDEGGGAACNRALKRAQITRELILAMPRFSGFYQKFSRVITDTLLFQEMGFRTGVQFTYEIPPAPGEELWRAMRDKTRNVIRRAGEIYSVSACPDLDEFIAAYDRNLRLRRLRNDYGSPLLRRICDAATGRGQGQVLAARDAKGAMAAAIFCAWDAVSTYYLLTTRAPDSGNGAVALLLWNAIQDSAARGLIFDFDGVGLEGSRLFFTGFGGIVRPRYIAARYTLAHKIAHRVLSPFDFRAGALHT